MPRNSAPAADTGLPVNTSEQIGDVHHRSLILVGLLEAADRCIEAIGGGEAGKGLFACLDRALMLSREVEADLGRMRG